MKTILIVDDDEDLLFSYQTLLENDETIIYLSSTVKKALTILDSTEIDIAILDFMLPEVTGDKLGLYINKIHPRIRLYFISGYDEAVGAIEDLGVKMDGFFKKPVEPEYLQQIVEGKEIHPSKKSSDLPPETLHSYLRLRR